MKKNLSLILFLFITYIANAQMYPIFESFENQDYSDWTYLDGEWSITNFYSSNGDYSLACSEGTLQHYNGLRKDFIENISPDYVAYSCQTNTTNGSLGYFALGNVSEGQCIFYSYFDFGYLKIVAGDQNYSIEIEDMQMYDIEIKDLNYTDHTFDIYIDDVLIGENAEFINNDINGVDVINIYNINPGISWYDKIEIYDYLDYPYYSGFEDGYFDFWIEEGGQNQATPTFAASGQYSLMHYNTETSYYKGLFMPLIDVSPTYIGYYVTVANSNASGYVSLGNQDVDRVCSSYFSNNKIHFSYDSSISFDITIGNWYHVEYKNIDYENYTLDIYLDGELVVENAIFATETTSFSKIHFYNYTSNSTAWLDELYIGLPEPVFISQPQNVELCDQTEISFSVDCNFADSYKWQIDDGNGFVDIEDNEIYSNSDTAVLTITGADVNYDIYQYRCRIQNADYFEYSGAVQIITDDMVRINSQPETSVSKHVGEQLIFNIEAQGANLTYQWQKDGENIVNGGSIVGTTTSELQIISLTEADAGIYNCIVTGDCSEETTENILLFVLPTSIDEINCEVQIFPNPVENYINIVGGNPENYVVTDISGKTIKKGELQNSQIDVSELKSGIYFIMIQNNQKISTFKIIKN